MGEIESKACSYDFVLDKVEYVRKRSTKRKINHFIASIYCHLSLKFKLQKTRVFNSSLQKIAFLFWIPTLQKCKSKGKRTLLSISAIYIYRQCLLKLMRSTVLHNKSLQFK